MAVRNRTARYLYSVFSAESANFKRYYNSLRRKGLFIGDDHYKKEEGVVYNSHIFVLVDVPHTEEFDEALAFFRVYDNYEDDYYVDDRHHMLVFKVDEKFRKSMYYFKRSQYSKMYTRDYLDIHYQISKSYELTYDGNPLTLEGCMDMIEKIGSTEKFMSDARVSTYAVLSGSNALRNMLNEIYGFKRDARIKRGDQLDSKIDLSEEVYRYDPNLRSIHLEEEEEAAS